MFRGQYEHAIDVKGRTSLPSRYRDVLVASGDLRLVITRSPFRDDACLHAYPMKAWEEIEAKISAFPEFDPSAVRLRRLYVSAAVECDVDKQGRVLVPTMLREFAALTKDVVWAGMGRKAELWAKDRWAAAVATTDEQEAELRRAFAEHLRV